MKNKNANTLVFVYGSLKSNFYNHSLLLASEFVSTHITKSEFKMVDLGMYPAVLNEGVTAISGEIYRVNQDVFESLDQLEGYPDYYDRVVISTEFGNVWMYILQINDGSPIVSSGIWE